MVSPLLSHVFIVSVYLVVHTRNSTSYILLSHINTEVMSYLIQKERNKKTSSIWTAVIHQSLIMALGLSSEQIQTLFSWSLHSNWARHKQIHTSSDRKNKEEKRAGLGENDRGVGGYLSILRWSGKTSDKGTFAQGPEGSKEAKPCTDFGYKPFRRRWARKLPCCQAGMNKRQVVGNDIRVLDVMPQRQRDGFWNLFWEKLEALGGL